MKTANGTPQYADDAPPWLKHELVDWQKGWLQWDYDLWRLRFSDFDPDQSDNLILVCEFGEIRSDITFSTDLIEENGKRLLILSLLPVRSNWINSINILPFSL